MREILFHSPESVINPDQQLINNLIASPREIKTRVIQTFIDKSMRSPVHSNRTNINY